MGWGECDGHHDAELLQPTEAGSHSALSRVLVNGVRVALLVHGVVGQEALSRCW